MALFLPQRWRRQPTGPVGINRSHFLASQLRLCVIGNSLVPRNLVDGTAATLVGTGHSVIGTNAGLGLRTGTGTTRSWNIPFGITAGQNGAIYWMGMRHGTGPAIWRDATFADGNLLFDSAPGFYARLTGLNEVGVGSFPQDTLVNTLAGYDQSKYRFYSNGVATVPGTSCIDNYPLVSPLHIGQNGIGAGNVDCTTVLLLGWGRVPSFAEYVELYNNPWQLFAPQKRVLYFGAAAGGGVAVNVDVPAAAITIAAAVPVVNRTQSVVVPAAAITVAANAPTVDRTQSVAVPAAAVTIAAVAPTIAQAANQSVVVPAASIAIAANAPVVDRTQSVVVPAAGITVAANAPTIAQSGSLALAIPVAAITIAAIEPTVNRTQSISVPAAAVTVAAVAPTVTQAVNQSVNVPAAAITIAAFAPTVGRTVNQSVDVPSAAITVAAVAPVVNRTQSILVPAAAITVGGYAPVITQLAGLSLDIPAVNITVQAYAPAVGVVISVVGPPGTSGAFPRRAAMEGLGSSRFRSNSTRRPRVNS